MEKNIFDIYFLDPLHNPESQNLERSKSRKTQNPDKPKIPTNSKSRQTQNPDKLKIPTNLKYRKLR
jgi:hypothetical protein